VLELEDFDGILGNDFMKQFDAVNIDYTAKSVKVQYAREEINLKCPRPDITSAKFFRRWVKRSKTPYYLAMVTPKIEQKLLSIEEFGRMVIAGFRKEFQKVFAEDLPDKEPRKGTHRIELESEEIPKKRPARWSPEQEAELSK